MSKRSLVNLVVGILVGLILAWLLGLFDPQFGPANGTTSPVITAANPAKPVLVTVTSTRSDVVMPAAAAVPAHGPDPAPPALAGGTAAIKTSLDPTQSQVQTRSRAKAVTNNLRVLGSAAQQYMEEKGLSSASYRDLVGTETDNYIRGISPVSGEDYTVIIIFKGQTQISVTSDSFGTVTYNL